MDYCILFAVNQNPTCPPTKVVSGSNATSAQPLINIPLGAIGVVADLNVTAETRTRLMEFGVLCGTAVGLVRFAPLGDPVEIKVRGYHLTLRKHEAQQILVTVQGN